MTSFQFALKVKKMTEMAGDRAEDLVQGTVRDLVRDMIEVQPSKSVTGTYEVGKMPYLTGQSARAFRLFFDGRLVGSGDQPSFDAIISTLKLGQSVKAGYSLSAAPHVLHIEYGTGKFPGRFPVRSSVRQFQAFFEKNLARVRG